MATRQPLRPCTCVPCMEYEPVLQSGEHIFRLDTGDVEGWRWLCSCRQRGRWTFQSEAAAYHKWLNHIAKES
jgi:hypothetical protein